MMFDWCKSGDHDNCRRSLERFTIDPKKNTVVWLGEQLKCECDTRSCPCWVRAVDRNKPNRKRK